MVLKRNEEIADNTDVVLSMGSLLEDFVERFSGPEHALEHVRIASGYLYRAGFARTLRLLDNPRIKSVRLLFSGRTDRTTARALTALLDKVLRSELENDPNASELWSLGSQSSSIRATRRPYRSRRFMSSCRADQGSEAVSGLSCSQPKGAHR
jgi:hypothetical protein